APGPWPNDHRADLSGMESTVFDMSRLMDHLKLWFGPAEIRSVNVPGSPLLFPSLPVGDGCPSASPLKAMTAAANER
ncbi:hypothetical protein JYT83_00220, partial [bacterium AH-315-F18]|nr:hypothetical protein [bacterium AH-315-F18]